MQTIRTNLKNVASTQYINFNHTSMCMFNGVPLGAGSDGFFKIVSGDSDNGVNIDAYFKTIKTDLGTQNLKRSWYLYLGWYCQSYMTVEITGDDKTMVGPYTITAVPGKGQHEVRTKLGRGLAWTYSTFKFSNVNGSDFSIDSASILATHKSGGGR